MDLVISENAIFTLPIVDVNGDPLAVASLEKLKIQVIQYNRLKGEFVLYPTPDPVQTEIRVNPDTDTSLDFELTQELSSTLKHGELYLKIFMTNAQANFLTDEEWTDIDLVKVADMV